MQALDLPLVGLQIPFDFLTGWLAETGRI